MQIPRTKILGFTLSLGGLALCCSGLWLLLSPAQYQATTRIRLENEPIDGPMFPESIYDPYFIQTEVEIIQSPLVLSNVVESLNLNVEWDKKYGDGNPFETVKVIKLLKCRINLQLIHNTWLIAICVNGDDPNETAGIANAIAKAYQDFRTEKRKQLTQEGLQVLTEQYQQLDQTIKAKQENLGQLAMQLNLPNPEPTGELLKSNYPSYFLAEQDLQNVIEIHKLIATRIEEEKLDIQIRRPSFVQIVEVAKSPELPIGPNRWLGATLLAIGLFPIVGGFLLLKSSSRQSV